MNKPKYLVFICEGLADEPIESLNGQTPLEIAKTPNLDLMAKEGCVGRAAFCPEGSYPDGSITNLSLFGYNPLENFCGRGICEAASMNVLVDQEEIVFRCNFVTVSESDLIDFSAGQIATHETSALISDLNAKLGNEKIRFFPGVGHRAILLIKDESELNNLKDVSCYPPQHLIGKNYNRYLPKGKGSKTLHDLIKNSKSVLDEHPINHVRIDLNENPANMIWIWGQGPKVNIKSFYEKYSQKGLLISSSHLLSGLGKILGLDIEDHSSSTDTLSTDIDQLTDSAIQKFNDYDIVFLHINTASQASFFGDYKNKIRMIENIDAQIMARLIEIQKQLTDLKILITSNNTTSVVQRSNTATPVPFLVCGANTVPNDVDTFDEVSAAKSGANYTPGYELMNFFLKR